MRKERELAIGTVAELAEHVAGKVYRGEEFRGINFAVADLKEDDGGPLPDLVNSACGWYGIKRIDTGFDSGKESYNLFSDYYGGGCGRYLLAEADDAILPTEIGNMVLATLSENEYADENSILIMEFIESNTRIDYLYRDASNYKIHSSVIIKGELSDAEIREIVGCLDEGEYFLPGQVGLPSGNKYSGTEDDHPWFELGEWSFSTTMAKPTAGVTATGLLENFRKAKEDGWDEEKYGY